MMRRRVEMAAACVALRAKSGALRAESVAQIEFLAADLLDAEAPMRLAVERFAAQWRDGHRDPETVAQAGDELYRAVVVALMPLPPDLHRRDVHG